MVPNILFNYLVNLLCLDTCKVAKTKETFEEVRETELKGFRVQLETIVQDINRVLQGHQQDSNANTTVSTREECESDCLSKQILKSQILN